VLLKLKGKDLPFLPLGSSEKIEVGTRIAVVGSPLGLEGTLTEGIVSAVRELFGELKRLQITAAISPGSSGSPVLNAKGEVIGVAAATLREGQSLNFAVPVEADHALVARAEKTPVALPVGRMAVGDHEKIFADPDWRAAAEAQAAQDYVAMLTHAQALVRRYPENAPAHGLLGVAYHWLKFYDDAIAALKQAIKLKPDLAEAWYLLGFSYRRAGRWEDAMAAFRRARGLKPELFK
jgi:S1-C subfamily serine protease